MTEASESRGRRASSFAREELWDRVRGILCWFSEHGIMVGDRGPVWSLSMQLPGEAPRATFQEKYIFFNIFIFYKSFPLSFGGGGAACVP